MTAAIFLDRDNLIVYDPSYVHKIEDFRLMPNAVEGLKRLSNYNLFIITNQSGIGRGYYTLKDFENFNNHLLNELKKHRIKIQKTYCCPHKPEDNCECRKPKTRLLKNAEKEFKIDLKESFVIGDKKSDVELGKNSGCKTILIVGGDGMKVKNKAGADYTANDLLDAAKWILSNK